MRFHLPGSICLSWLVAASLTFGCGRAPAPQQRPTEQNNVYNALMINGLTNVTVSENQTTGIMTLAGSVRSQEEKAQAGQIARINAIDYKIVNNIAITQPAQANLDTGITDNYKDLLKANKILDGQNIDYKAESGVLVLSGTVHNARERAEAVRLAKSVANVKQVQDKIRVRP